MCSLFVKSFYYAPGFKNYAHLLKATNYDAGIMYTSLGFMPGLLHVLAVSNSTMQVPCPQFVGFGRCGHTESPMHTYENCNTWARSSKFNVDVMTLRHILINANPCCVLRYKFQRYSHTNLPVCTKIIKMTGSQLHI